MRRKEGGRKLTMRKYDERIRRKPLPLLRQSSSWFRMRIRDTNPVIARQHPYTVPL
jgi:hypothetical protein